MNYPYSTLWKTDEIYQLYTYKKVEYKTGIKIETDILGYEILSEDKKISAKYINKYMEKLYNGKNNDGTTPINSFIHESLKICPFDKEIYKNLVF